MRAAGLEERAAELEAEAAQLRKRAPALPPGRRLDLAEGYLRRCEKRAAQSTEATAAAEQKLEEARLQQAAAEKEAREADEQLQQLRQDLAGAAEAAMPEAEAGGSAAAAQAELEVARLRAALATAEAQRDSARVSAGFGPQTVALPNEDEDDPHSLQQQLAEMQRSFAAAVTSGRP